MPERLTVEEYRKRVEEDAHELYRNIIDPDDYNRRARLDIDFGEISTSRKEAVIDYVPATRDSTEEPFLVLDVETDMYGESDTDIYVHPTAEFDVSRGRVEDVISALELFDFQNYYNPDSAETPYGNRPRRPDRT